MQFLKLKLFFFAIYIYHVSLLNILTYVFVINVSNELNAFFIIFAYDLIHEFLKIQHTQFFKFIIYQNTAFI